MFIWEPTSAQFSNQPSRDSRLGWFENWAEGCDQLSEEGYQINIITDEIHAITIISIIHSAHVDLIP